MKKAFELPANYTLLFILYIFTILYPSGAYCRQQALSSSNIFKQASPSVVLIVTKDSLGSGVLISDTEILTNWHVVAKAKTVGVLLKPESSDAKLSKKDVLLAKVVRINQKKDLALLKIDTIPSRITPILLGNEKEIVIGADVHAIGHPSGETWTYTKGIISQIRNNFTWKSESGTFTATVIQTQTPINPGNSGGPLLSRSGKLVGINSAKARGEGLNFAIALSEIRAFLNESKPASTAKTGPPTDAQNTPSRSTRASSPAADKSELAFLLEKFLPAKGNKQRALDWSAEPEDTQVRWGKSGPATTKEGVSRKGKVFLTANGKTYYKIAERKTRLPWLLELNGDKVGANELSLRPHQDTFGSSGSGSNFDLEAALKLNTKLSITTVETRRTYGDREDYYILSCENKDPVLLVLWRTWGSGGESGWLSLFYMIQPTKESIRKFAQTISSIKEPLEEAPDGSLIPPSKKE